MFVIGTFIVKGDAFSQPSLLFYQGLDDAEQVSSLLSEQFNTKSLTKRLIIIFNKTYCSKAQSYRGRTPTPAPRVR